MDQPYNPLFPMPSGRRNADDMGMPSQPVRKAPHDPVPTVADAAFYERLDATLSPGTIAVAMALQEAAYRGRRDPDDMPTYPYPLFKAMAATIMTDPRVLESISMAVSLDQMIAEAAGPAEVPANV